MAEKETLLPERLPAHSPSSPPLLRNYLKGEIDPPLPISGDNPPLPLSPLALETRELIKEAGRRKETERREKERLVEVGRAQGDIYTSSRPNHLFCFHLSRARRGSTAWRL